VVRGAATVFPPAAALAQDVIRRHRPGLLVLNAGVAPIQEQTWESFSSNWHTDTRHVLAGFGRQYANRFRRAA
jgi:hypothetical protein